MQKLFSGLYWVMAAGLGASVALSATWGAYFKPTTTAVVAAEPGVTPESEAGRRCASSLAALYREQRERAGRTLVGDGGPTADLVQDWATWSTAWRERLRSQRVACRLDESPAMAPLATLASGLERLNLAYTTAVTGFSDVGRRQLQETQQGLEALGEAAALSPP